MNAPQPCAGGTVNALYTCGAAAVGGRSGRRRGRLWTRRKPV